MRIASRSRRDTRRNIPPSRCSGSQTKFFSRPRQTPMASPLGHSLIGLILARTHRVTPHGSTPLWWYAFAILAANAPDLDFLPGLFLDQPFRFHRGPAHSLMGAFVFGALVYALARGRTPRAGALAALGLGCYVSHLLLDLPGIPLLWPFSSAHLGLALPSLTEAIGWERTGGTAIFIDVLLSKAFVQTMIVEALVLLPTLLVVLGLMKLRHIGVLRARYRTHHPRREYKVKIYYVRSS